MAFRCYSCISLSEVEHFFSYLLFNGFPFFSFSESNLEA